MYFFDIMYYITKYIIFFLFIIFLLIKKIKKDKDGWTNFQII